MIIDLISELRSYVPVLPGLEKVVEVLESGRLENATDGKFLTDDPRVRFNVSSYDTAKESADEYEIHRKEADVQILLEGRERMDIAVRSPISVTKEYRPDADFMMAACDRAVSFHARPDQFVIFFPGEPHAPNLKDATLSAVRKVVFKILVG